MSAFHVHPAFSGAPFVAHLERRAVLLRMCVPCWEDACHDCAGGDCVCACRPVSARPARCYACGYLHGTIGHAVGCEPEALAALVDALAERIGAAS